MNNQVGAVAQKRRELNCLAAELQHACDKILQATEQGNEKQVLFWDKQIGYFCDKISEHKPQAPCLPNKGEKYEFTNSNK